MGLSQDDFGAKIGVSGKYVGMIERGQTEISPDNTIGILFKMLTQKGEIEIFGDNTLHDTEAEYMGTSVTSNTSKCRMVPVLGMAHAGQVIDYDEIAQTSAEFVPTLCQDKKAFGIDIQGDSMFPKIKDQDSVILSPEIRPYNGCIVVARIAGEGVVCRSVETVGGKVNLIPANDRYMAATYNESDFDWMYVVYGTWTQIYRG